MKILMRTILTNLIDSTIKEWQIRVPDKKLEDYDNWRIDIINKIDYLLTKQGHSLDEIIIDNTEEKKEDKV
jgi:hypothetical protein